VTALRDDRGHQRHHFLNLMLDELEQEALAVQN